MRHIVSKLSCAFVFIYSIAYLNYSDAIEIDKLQSKFIGDLFVDQSLMLTAHFCWSYERMRNFLRYMIHLPKLKQIAVYNDSVDYYNFFFYKSVQNYYIIDLNDCNASWNLLREGNLRGMFRFPLKYLLLISEDDFVNRITQVLSNYTIYPNSDILVAKRMDDGYELTQPYRVDAFSGVIWEEYGAWTLDNGVQVTVKYPPSRRRMDLRGTNITSGFLMEEEETMIHLDDMKFPRVDTFSKQNYPTVKTLMEKTNCNWHIVRVKDCGYYSNKTQVFSGLIRMVELGQVDLSGTSPFFTPERANAVDFLTMLNPMPMQFILKKPKITFMSNMYTLPFATRTWIALFIGLFLFFCGMSVIVTWETRQLKDANIENKNTLADVGMLVIEGICQQGTSFSTHLIPGRILQFIMFVCCLFLYTSFSAYIIVLLQTSVEIKSWRQLLDSNIAVGGQNTSYMYIYLSSSKNRIHQQIYRKKIGKKGYYDLDVGMAMVQKGSFAFHAEVAGALDYIYEKFTEYETCSVQIMPGFVDHLNGFTCVPKNSPFKEIFKVGLMRINEIGIQKRNIDRLLYPIKCYARGLTFVSAGIDDTIQAIIYLAYGTGIAFFILFIELFINYRMRRSNKHEKQFSGYVPSNYLSKFRININFRKLINKR